MSIKKYLLAALLVGVLSLIYNYSVFSILGIYPDLDFELKLFNFYNLDLYLVIFLKNFLVGLILTVLYSQGYRYLLRKDIKSNDGQAKGIFFFILYAIFALLSFSMADVVLLDSDQGLLLLLTVDGFVETLIATVPIRLFQD